MNAAYREDPDLAEATFDDLFAELHAYGDRPPVPVGPTLQHIFDGPGAVPSRRRPHIGRGPLIGLAVAGTVAGGLGAAAADELPRPLQRAVSTVVNNVTPFTIATGDEPESDDAPIAPSATIPPAEPPGNPAEADDDDDSAVRDSDGDKAPLDDDDLDSEPAEPEDSDDDDSENDESDSDDDSDDSEDDEDSSDEDASSDDEESAEDDVDDD